LRENAHVSQRQSVVIIPTYNEAENLRRIIPPLLDLSLHILIVDDASRDGTAQVAKELGAATGLVEVLERPGKLGLGSAYRDGFAKALRAGFTTIIQMDADGSHRVDDLRKMLEFFSERPMCDVVIGSRWIPGGHVTNWPRYREILSRSANRYAKMMLGFAVHDSTAGFRIYRADLLKKMNVQLIESEGYAFQIEMNYKAWRSGARVQEIPIIFMDRVHGTSKMSKNIVYEAAFLVWKLKLTTIFTFGRA
jgi:dolichol-phosphate mannosyltransferase